MSEQWNYIRRWAEGSKDEEPIGTLEWAERPGRTFELHLDVDPAVHRKGIGRSMVEELETLAKAREGMSLYSFSAHDNVKANGFFTGVGFTAYPIWNFYGTDRHAWFYVKTIGAPK